MLEKLSIKGFKSIQSLDGLDLLPINLLIDFFKPDEILTVNRVRGASVFERQSRARLDKWLESYSIGQLWRKNVIRGGVTSG